MEKYKLTLQRKASLVGAAANISVVINDTFETKMPVGSNSVFEVDYKPTKIRFYIRQMGITTIDQTIMVDPHGFKDLIVRYSMTMKSVFTTKTFSMQTKNDAIEYEVLYGTRRDNETTVATEPANVANFASRPTFCSRCGASLPENAAFCPRCGNKI